MLIDHVLDAEVLRAGGPERRARVACRRFQLSGRSVCGKRLFRKPGLMKVVDRGGGWMLYEGLM